MIHGVVNEKALVELGWPRLCAELAARARTPMGKERSLALVPSDEPDEARRSLALVEEARTLRRFDRELPLAEAVDVRVSVGRAAREGTLESGELSQIARVIRATESARRFCFGQADRAPLHYELAQTLSELGPIAQEIERAFDAAGKLLDTASPLLGELRERARGLHRAIKARIEELLADEKIIPMLRESYYSVRGDRYVLPIRAEHKTHLPGIVHNASGSGQTLFVEPQQLVELGNQLTIAESSILEEELRILGELSGAVGKRAPLIEHDVETIGVLDAAAAGARFADDIGAAPPEVGGDRFELIKLRHPFLALQKRDVVANDVSLAPGAQALIVSGPNAGGKTVTITAVGLSALMARAGLPIAAEPGSKIPFYRTVYTAIGDEGDMSRDLSTFTAHLTALKHILEAAGPGTLVLIDEIAADTDPREGAAIAIAALERLVAVGAQVLITTHLEELKALALSDPRFAPASVGFDLDRLAPTYMLKLGEVGASAAIEIARRVGISAEVCGRAREILGAGGSALSQAVEKLDAERASAAAARRELEEARAELQREREQVAAERARLRELELQTRAGAREELVADIAARRAEVAQMVAQLQAAPAMAQAVEAQRALEQQLAAEKKEQVREEEAPAAEAAGVAVAVGARVKHAGLGTEGVVLELHGTSAMVQFGALKSKVSLGDLVPVAGQRKALAQPGFKKSRQEKIQRGADAAAQAVEVKHPLIDVRGQRVDEALRNIDSEFDRLLRAGEETALVLHGHGSGALKGAIREHLQRSPYVTRARPAENHEGGDGVTVVTLSG